MNKLVTFNELSRLNPERLYWYYRQLSITLNKTEKGSAERLHILASIENVLQAINLHNCDKWEWRLE